MARNENENDIITSGLSQAIADYMNGDLLEKYGREAQLKTYGEVLRADVNKRFKRLFHPLPEDNERKGT